MSLKPPARFSAMAPASGPLMTLEHELMAESAQNLGRAAHDLRQALERLAAFDADTGSDEEREGLIANAGERLWRLVVQREACGFRDTEALMRDYRVPAEVRLRMGVRRPSGKD
jgi:hypothetical protein